MEVTEIIQPKKDGGGVSIVETTITIKQSNWSKDWLVLTFKTDHFDSEKTIDKKTAKKLAKALKKWSKQTEFKSSRNTIQACP